MGTLSFFPWLTIREEISIGPYTLIPYIRNEAPAGKGTDLQKQMDLVLGMYVENPDTPIADATIVKYADRNVDAVLSAEDVTDLQEFAEIFTFAGLADREYFRSSGYVCREDFAFFIQHNKVGVKDVATITRRRDGSQSTFHLGGRLFSRPLNTSRDAYNNISTPLLEALLKERASESDLWAGLVDAIHSFNLANTDSDQVYFRTELVLLLGAFERLFGLNGGEEIPLVTKFTQHFQPLTNLTKDQCPRIPSGRYADDELLRRIWLKDFYRLRGDLAHGRRSPEYPAIWNLQEHLLLASYIFPLAVKVMLAQTAGYELSDDDKIAINSFERMLCVNLFEPPPEQQSSNDSYLSRIQNDMRWEILRHKIETDTSFDGETSSESTGGDCSG